MHAVLAWMIGSAYISYKYGYKCKQLPYPKHYIALTGFVSLASLIGAFNPMIASLIAYGTLFGVFITTYNQPTKCDQTGQSSSSQPGSSTPQKPTHGNVPGSNANIHMTSPY
jgi:hypothetical protein